MRKILCMLAGMAMLFSVSAATQVQPESVIEKPGFWDCNYVSLTAGVNTDMKIDRRNLTVYPELNVYAGHWFTPVWGIELNGEMTVWDSFKTRDCFVKNSYVGVSGIANFTNLFGGYKSRVCEVLPFAGVGWLHGYTRGSGDTDDIAVKAGVDVRFNLNDRWALDVRPAVLYNLTGGKSPEYNINYGRLGIEVGATYNIGNKFVQKEVVDWDAYSLLNDEVNELKARGPETVYITREVKEKVEQYRPVNIGFTINSDKIYYTQMAALSGVAETMKNNGSLTATVYGYADSGTGTPQYNMDLSERRAEAVKKALADMGVDESRVTVEAEGSCTQIYPENDWNRAAVIVLK